MIMSLIGLAASVIGLAGTISRYKKNLEEGEKAWMMVFILLILLNAYLFLKALIAAL
jgi:hypothetical protein